VLPTITCPANLNLTTNTACTATGVVLGTPTTNDNCTVASVTNDHASTTYPLGTTLVTWTVTDGSGNTATCTQTVTVTDNVKPVFQSCPVPVAGVPNFPGCVDTLTLPNPVVTDNCTASPVLTWTMSGATTATGTGFVGFHAYNVGLTTITYTATDASGNTATCITTVNVTSALNGTIAGTSTVAQNLSTTSTITFTGSGGRRPYTFTYSINGGSPQTVSTTGNNNLVTVPQSNAVIGTFVYTLISTTDSLGCVKTAAPGTTATITVVAALPDFTPAITMDDLNFSGTGDSHDFYVNISNIKNAPSIGQLKFRIQTLAAYTLVPKGGTVNVDGGTVVQNGLWDFDYSNPSFLVVTLHVGNVLGGFSNNLVGFNLTRKPGVASNTIQNLGVTIFTNTGGDSNSANNISSTGVTAL
jgi:hypothetical protein